MPWNLSAGIGEEIWKAGTAKRHERGVVGIVTPRRRFAWHRGGVVIRLVACYVDAMTLSLEQQSAKQFLSDRRRDTPLTVKPALRVWLRKHPRFRRIDDAELYARARAVSQGKLHAVDRASCIAVLLSNAA